MCVCDDTNVFVVKSRPWTCAVVELGELGSLPIDKADEGSGGRAGGA